MIPGKGPSLNTSQEALAKDGRVGVPVNMDSIPDELEVVHTKGTHYELAAKKDVNLLPEEFQAKLSSVTCNVPGA